MSRGITRYRISRANEDELDFQIESEDLEIANGLGSY